MKARTGCVRFNHGRWEIDFRDHNGRRHQEALGDLRVDGKRWQREAEARLHERLKEVNAGSYQAPAEQMSVNEIVKAYIDNQVASTVEPETLAEYRQEAAIYIARVLGDPAVPGNRVALGAMMAREVKRIHIEQWRARLLMTPKKQQRKVEEGATAAPLRTLSPRTVAKAMTLLTASYAYAVGHEWLPRNPCLGVRKPSKTTNANPEPAEVNALSLADLSRLFAHATDRWEVILKWAAKTGMREAEICGLRWDDIDFKTNTAFVRQTFRRGRFKIPKTPHSVRRVSFPASLVLELKAWKLRTSKGNRYTLVFPTQDGGPQNPSNLLQRGLYPALKRAGLRKITFHGLRHSYATAQLAAGENLGPVSKQLGHANVAITQAVYRHVLPGEDAGMADRMDARLEQAATVWKERAAPAQPTVTHGEFNKREASGELVAAPEKQPDEDAKSRVTS